MRKAPVIPSPSVLVVGHRGSRGTHPENTIASFAEAVAAGAHALELDVQMLKDESLVVFHDAEVNNRLCRLHGKRLARKVPLMELTAADLAAYDCPGDYQVLFPRQKRGPRSPILTLEEFFAWVKEKNVPQRLFLELKMPPEEQTRVPDRALFAGRVAAAISAAGLSDKLIVQSFDYSLLRAVQKEMPGIECSHLFHYTDRFAELAVERGANRVTPNFSLLSAEKITLCHRHGIRVFPYTVNREAQWRRCLRWGVDGIITDYPRALRAFLKRAGALADDSARA